MKLLVDEMPKTPTDCPYGDDFNGSCSVLCTYHSEKKHVLEECSDTRDCPYFKAIGDTSLAEKVSEMEWRHRNYSEEE